VTEPDPIVLSAQQQLGPLFEAVLTQFEQDESYYEQSFFTTQYTALKSATDEMQIAELFLQLSTVAFVGFQFSAPQALLVDALLEKAEQMAHALSADDGDRH
jgi:hypothetical protein